ncbi:transketolase C-terminal domain-containing protein [Herbaspirillum sp. RTI4]|uniref:alpha-ketoacid dehydrogenase subunit beta n=1 Tax=Herbaspirillum sp. RTI4 TaxID=3048640 RepID=UPI002AB568DF|nr:transketolase C-terminal domain-containing protein [Herbaspirillum sp. RTI4]MDY7577028.1 transketolase C-terminal domain-containing protein [Herbaspirillum sp. RTI4]MEA9983099.1 transketolase C-terminal domain-containing protein [Herbaspirillum sp. RTI4]
MREPTSLAGRQLSFSKAINEALTVAMEADRNVICYGLGTDDPKGIFGTTLGLQEKFGEARVFDMPLSENAMTGVAIGCALNGVLPVMCHQRLDFFLLAMDQLVNNAAKWFYMFDGQCSVPITIRLILGRGWGQGPTHSQNLQAWFAHIPGLKVVMPSSPEDAKGLLLASIFDPNPVLFIEHRWLHNMVGDVPEGDFRSPIGPLRVAREGSDITIVSMSYMTIEALHAATYLQTRGISCEVLDLRCVNPIDWPAIFASVEKTGKLLTLDTGAATGSIAGEVIARVAMERMSSLRCAPARLAMPDVPEPTSFGMTEGFYVRAGDIATKILCMMGKEQGDVMASLPEPTPHDVPGAWFTGPF